jgi:hypothetical protein
VAGLRIRGTVVLLQRAGGGGWLPGLHCYGNKLESTGVHDTQHTLNNARYKMQHVHVSHKCMRAYLMSCFWQRWAYFCGQNRF